MMSSISFVIAQVYLATKKRRCVGLARCTMKTMTKIRSKGVGVLFLLPFKCPSIHPAKTLHPADMLF